MLSCLSAVYFPSAKVSMQCLLKESSHLHHLLQHKKTLLRYEPSLFIYFFYFGKQFVCTLKHRHKPDKQTNKHSHRQIQTHTHTHLIPYPGYIPLQVPVKRVEGVRPGRKGRSVEGREATSLYSRPHLCKTTRLIRIIPGESARIQDYTPDTPDSPEKFLIKWGLSNQLCKSATD